MSQDAVLFLYTIRVGYNTFYMVGVSPTQPIRGYGERRKLASGVLGRAHAAKAFGLFWKPQNAPFCTCMPTHWVCHIWGKAEVYPMPQRSIAPAWLLFYWLTTIVAIEFHKRRTPRIYQFKIMRVRIFKVTAYNEWTQTLTHVSETYKNVTNGDVEDGHDVAGADKLFIISLHLSTVFCIAPNRSRTKLRSNRNAIKIIWLLSIYLGDIYRVAQLKWGQLTFLMVTFECIGKIQ